MSDDKINPTDPLVQQATKPSSAVRDLSQDVQQFTKPLSSAKEWAQSVKVLKNWYRLLIRRP